MAHFAITEIGTRDHRIAERFSRGAAGLAGARAEPFEVWLDDWRAASLSDSFLPLELNAREGDLRLALRVEAGKPPVLQGEQGLSRKGPEPGNASYYYSYTRLPVNGELGLGGDNIAVRGEAWLDREWSSSSLGAGVQGWDWFGLQLDDGRELMLYSLRDESGRPTAFSAATLVSADGSAEHFAVDAFELAPRRRWRSPATGVSWPVEWRLRLPDADLHLDVRALVDDQEQRVAVLYWEGAVEVLDPEADAPIGRGYLEMTGYTGP
jgi:predicted secreted hydrolase